MTTMRTPRRQAEPTTGSGAGAPRYTPARPRWQRAQAWTVGLIRSFGYAIAGIVQLIRRQRNAQIHLFVTIIVCLASLAWGLSRMEWVALILTIAMVLGMEAVNTAVESVVDLASPEYHPLAKQAKDVAAGGVLLVAIGAACVALLLFGGRLLDLARWLLG